MVLLPFRSYAIPRGVRCPMCAWEHPICSPMTRYCLWDHPDGQPEVPVGAIGQAPIPHLHRTCWNCQYEWLEETHATATATALPDPRPIIMGDGRRVPSPPSKADDFWLAAARKSDCGMFWLGVAIMAVVAVFMAVAFHIGGKR